MFCLANTDSCGDVGRSREESILSRGSGEEIREESNNVIAVLVVYSYCFVFVLFFFVIYILVSAAACDFNLVWDSNYRVANRINRSKSR